MQIVHFKSQEFFDYLRSQGCNEYELLLDRKVVIFCKGDDEDPSHITPIKIKRVYFPYYVKKVCEDLEIPLPEKFAKFFEQINQLKKNK